MTSVSETIFSLYLKKRLAPFYIIRPPVSASETPEERLKEVFNSLSTEVLKHHGCANTAQTLELGHSDIVFIQKEEKLKNYKQDDSGMRDFFSAQKHGPLSLHKKMIWVDQAHHITERFLNKWLKTLEEPNAEVVTFFLVPHHAPLLQTIESRAISLKIKAKNSETRSSAPVTSFTEFIDNRITNNDLKKALSSFLKNPKQIHEALENIKNKPELQHALLSAFQDYWCVAPADPRQMERALEEIKWNKRSSTYHNLATERIYGLLSCLTDQI